MVKTKARKIVVLGGGVAGIRMVQDLAKKISGGYEIILIDKSRVHVFRGDLYEVATAFNKKITDRCLTELKETVATPIIKLIDPDRVRFICDEILEICHNESLVRLRDAGNLHYDYLVVALGSETNYFGIPGLKENSFAMKTVEDAIKINCHLDQPFSSRVRDVHIAIGGGGATGVEMACEMVGAVSRLCKKYKYPSDKVFVHLIEGTDTLIALPGRGTGIVLKRLKKLGVVVHLQRFIAKVTKSEITLKSSDCKLQTIKSDILIWTGGVMVNPVVADCLGSKNCRGAIKVNPFLQSEKYRNVFAAGDNAYVMWGTDPESGQGHAIGVYRAKPLPMLAQVAYQEGALIADNLFRLICGKQMIPFKCGKLMLLVPLGGKYALFKTDGKIFAGFWCWMLKRLVYFKYALSIMPFWRALGKLKRSTKVFVEND